MKCINCGQALSDGASYCPECGTRQEAAVEAVLQEPVAEDVWEEKPFRLNLEEKEAETPEKKPNRKKTVLILSAIAAVLLLAVGLIGFLALDWGLYIRDFFQRRKEPETYKNIVEERAVTDGGMSELGMLKKLVLSAYATNREAAELGGQELTVELKLDGELRSMLKLALGGDEDALALLDSLGKVELDLTTANGTDRMQGVLKLGLDGEHLITVDVVLDMAGDDLYLTVPELNETACRIPLEDAPALLQSFAYSQRTNQAWNRFLLRCPDEETLAQTVDSFLIPAIREIDRVEMDTDGQLEAGGVSQNVTVLTYDITDETLKDMTLAMLKAARDDDRVLELLDNYSRLAEELNVIYQEQAEKGLLEKSVQLPTLDGTSVEEAIAEVESWETDGETVLTVKTYVNRKGQITGRTYQLESGEELCYQVVIKGRNVGVKVQAESNGEKLTLEGSAKYRGGLNGSAALKYNRQELLILELQDIPLKGRGGTILVQPGAYVTEMLADEAGVAASLLDLAELGIRISLEEETTGIALQMGGDDLITVNMQKKTVAAQQVSLPQDATEKPMAWMLGVDTGALTDMLEKLGLQAETIEALLELLLGSVLGTGSAVA